MYNIFTNGFMGYKGVIKNSKVYSEDKKFILLSIEHIEIGTEELDNALMQISLDPDNLFYLLREDEKSDENLKRILLSFSCAQDFNTDQEIKDYIDLCISNNRSFYSFLAEMLQALLLKDVCRYNLVTHVIDYSFNPSLTHQGPDSCLYSEEDKKIVIGEAKFIENCSDCFNHIINDFKSGSGLLGKLLTLSIAAQNDPVARQIIISKLGDGSLKMISLDQFLKNDLVFCGFALHNTISKKEKYFAIDFYDGYRIEVDEIANHIKQIYSADYVKNLEEVGKYKVIIFHLPINSKRELIFKIIKEAQKRYLDLA